MTCGWRATCPRVVVLLDGQVRFIGTPAALAQTASGRVWVAEQRDPRAYVSWRDGDNRWRHIGEQPPSDSELVTPTAEDGYLVLTHTVGAV